MHQSSCNLKRLTTILLAVVLATGSITNLSVAQKKGGPKSPQDALQAQQELMLREIKFTDEQQKTIKEKFTIKLKALETWEKTNAEKLRAAEEAAKAARKGSDDAAKKKANSDLKDLEANRTLATADADKAILDVLTGEQKVIWAGVELTQTTLPRYKKVNLTDEQTAKIKSACLIAAKDLAAFPNDDRKDKQGRSTVQKSLRWAIDNVILTPEQREMVTRKPAKK